MKNEELICVCPECGERIVSGFYIDDRDDGNEYIVEGCPKCSRVIWAEMDETPAQSRLFRFLKYVFSVPWWEQGGRINKKWSMAHIRAHIQTAYISIYVVPPDGRLPDGGEYSPAATFHKLHKRLGGHGRGAY